MKTLESDLKYIKAKQRVEKLRRFYSHIAVYIIINLAITGLKVFRHADNWASLKAELLTINVLSVWVVWGIVLILHGLSLVFARDWEERKIAALMEKELSKNTKENYHGKI